MLFAELESGIRLSLIEEREAEEIFGVVDENREYLRRWLPWVDQTLSPSDTRGFLQSSLQQYAENRGFNLGIRCQGVFCGCAGFHPIDWTNRSVEIGYWVAEGYQGRGIITAACAALTDHAFQEWKLNRVQICCAVANERSCAIPRRLGFTLEGTLRKAQNVNGAFQDTYVFGMLADDWNTVVTKK